MIGVVVVTHGEFSNGIKNATEMIMGAQKNFSAVSLLEGANLDEFGESIYQTLENMSSIQDFIIFVDLFGATPFNTIAKQIEKLKSQKLNVKLVTGINLPMLLETIGSREVLEIEELYKKVIEVGISSIEGFDF